MFEGTLCLGALLAVVGGTTLGVLHLADPAMTLLPRLETAHRHILTAFACVALFALSAAAMHALSRPVPRAAPAPAPVPTALPAPLPGLQALYHEMKTYVDLEMWELALQKATAIVDGHPGTPEAEAVSKNLNELRWKAEPKYVAQGTPLSADQERQLRERGLAQMAQHVRTYMELEMWELARQKALLVLRNFPETPEAVELMKHFDTIERKAREAVGPV